MLVQEMLPSETRLLLYSVSYEPVQDAAEQTMHPDHAKCIMGRDLSSTERCMANLGP